MSAATFAPSFKASKVRQPHYNYTTRNTQPHPPTKHADRRHELASGAGEQVNTILAKASRFDQDIQRPQEEVIASGIFAMAAETALQVAKKLAQGGKTFTPADFVRHLKAHYVDDANAQEVGAQDPTAFNWNLLGRKFARFFRAVPGSSHMVGPMAAVPKPKKKAAQRRARAPVAPVVRPDEISTVVEEKQETDRNMMKMWEVLGEQPGATAEMLRLVVNHKSFAQTTENLFTLSFMVSGGKVTLKRSDDGILVTRCSGGPKAKEDDRMQFVVALDMELWEEWCTVVDEKDVLMPHREGYHGGGGSGRQQPQRVEEEEEEEDEEQQKQKKSGGGGRRGGSGSTSGPAAKKRRSG